ncbi:MAG TPA: glycosyltransferase family 39 protein [Thermoguttaceae bacterium]|nr:glycosyltransferase family 39 protein [Thermoguttaceae bacterium]
MPPERRPSGWLLAGLVLVCFVPRAWLCLECKTICPDAVVYMDAADALERGDGNRSLDYLGPNLYPSILVALRHTGLEWNTAAAWWSVVFASLAVLPLFGLTRRMWDGRAAVAASLLYAVHPYLLIYTPWMLRDPTHWFLFLLTLYLIWRATDEGRWIWFVAAGTSLALAVHVRNEAWLLVLPLAGWGVWRWFENPPRRRRLAAGTLLCLAMAPAALLVLNLTVLAGHSHWKWGGSRHVVDARRWAKATWTQGEGRADASTPPEQVNVRPPAPLKISSVLAVRKVLVRAVKSLTYPYVILAILSLWVDRRRHFGPRELPLLLACVVLLLGLSGHMAIGKDVSPRYLLVFVLLALPAAARGAIHLSQAAANVLGRMRATPVRPGVVLAGLMFFVFVGSAAWGWRAWRDFTEPWNEQAALGRWILATYGPRQRIASNLFGHRLVVYYAQGASVHARWEQRHDSRVFASLMRRERPDVLAVWENGDVGRSRDTYHAIMRDRKRLGYQLVAVDDLPPECPGVRILVREGASREPKLFTTGDAEGL